MPTAMTAAEFAEWEPRQPVRFALVDGQPMRLPEADQGPTRLERVRQVAARTLASSEAAANWMRWVASANKRLRQIAKPSRLVFALSHELGWLNWRKPQTAFIQAFLNETEKWQRNDTRRRRISIGGCNIVWSGW